MRRLDGEGAFLPNCQYLFKPWLLFCGRQSGPPWFFPLLFSPRINRSSRCGLWISITWTFVRNAHSGVPTLTCRIGNFGVVRDGLWFKKPPGYCDMGSSLRTPTFYQINLSCDRTHLGSWLNIYLPVLFLKILTKWVCDEAPGILVVNEYPKVLIIRKL